MATNGQANGNKITLPAAKSRLVSPSVTIQPPLSRRGDGPGLLILVDVTLPLEVSSKHLDPPPLLKWAEEGFAVAQIKLSSDADLRSDVQTAIKELSDLETCTSTNDSGYGVLLYASEVPGGLAQLVDEDDAIKAVVSYGPHVEELGHHTPQLVHLHEGREIFRSFGPGSRSYSYTEQESFVIPSHPNFSPPDAALAHTRTLTFVKPLLGGPYFDLEAIWEEHTLYEFGERDVEKTMATMVAEPYVNHIPTLTGGIGRAKLTSFYTHHFVHSNPPDTAMKPISRTVGIDRVVDEFVFSFTHDRVIDWILPGVPPTYRKVEVPFVGIINIRGDRLFHEHISWDQATVLRQIGLLPEYLPFPHQIGGKQGKFEYQLPVVGVESAEKLRDESAVESNGLFRYAVREDGK